jgi:hypothetical protein
LGRTQPTGIGIDKQADEVALEVNFMNSDPDGLEPDVLAAEGSTDDTDSSAPTNVTTGRNATLEPGLRITRLGQSSAMTSATFAIEAGWQSLTQRFMRTLFIVVSDPACGAPLLAARRGSSGRSHIGFVNPMHLLVRGVVLRSRPACKLDANAQAQPPGREARQIQGAIAGKGPAVIDADHFGQAITRKEPLKILADRFVAETQQPDAQNKTAEQVAHGQGIDTLAVASAKPPFEVYRPYVVGRLGNGQGRANQAGTVARPNAAPRHQVQPLQPAGRRAHRRQEGARVLPFELNVDLFGAQRGCCRRSCAMALTHRAGVRFGECLGARD